MKYFVITLALTCVAFIPNLASDVFSMCVLNEDWPNAPCYDQGTPAKNELKEAWAPYYDYKGKEWMEMKKTELVHVMLTGNLEGWSRGTGGGDLVNWNVYTYYSIFENLDIFKRPLHQIKYVDVKDVKCFDDLVLIQKYDGFPACVKSSSVPELIKRNWTTTEVLLNMPLSQMGEECGHYSHNEFFDRMESHTLDVSCHEFVIQNALAHEKEMLGQGYVFDIIEQVWKKDGFPDTMMSIAYHYMISLEIENEYIVISKWDFRQEPSYVIIPLGAVIEGNTSLIPEEITVVLGKNNTVTWINEDDTAHTFVSDHGGSEFWSTGMMKPGESSSVTFNRTGVFEYHGTPDPWETGKVIVVED